MKTASPSLPSQTISAFLVSALAVTGAVTLLVFEFPDIITIGLLAFILPGLILGLTPSIFFYLCLFSAGWFSTTRFPVWVRALAGVTAMFFVGVTVPHMLNATTARWLTEARARDLAPNSPVSRISSLAITPDHGHSGCGDVCQTLLFNGSVQNILEAGRADRSGNRIHYSFAIEPRATCPDAKKMLEGENWLRDRWKQVAKNSRLRIASGECLILQPLPPAPPDLELREVRETVGKAPARFGLAPGEVRVHALELRRGGKVIARVSRRQAVPLGIPLAPTIDGGSELRINGWKWTRTSVFEGDKEVFKSLTDDMSVDAFLSRFTDWNLAMPKGLDASALRKRLDQALADPSIPATDGAFALVQDYFEDLRGEFRKANTSVSADDVHRIARLIADPRATSFRALAIIPFAPSQLLALLNPALDRMVQLAGPNPAQNHEWEQFNNLSQLLARLPPAAFRNPDPRVEQLIATPDLREHASVLVRRLSDRGPAIVPRLIGFVQEGYKRQSDNRLRTEGSAAALRAICTLGPQIPEVLPQLRQLAAQGEIPPGAQESDLWRATLVSLSANPNEFNLPKDVQWRLDLYHESLRKMASRGCEPR